VGKVLEWMRYSFARVSDTLNKYVGHVFERFYFFVMDTVDAKEL
jgi:hypothetical protein